MSQAIRQRKSFQAWESKSQDTVYQAPQDGEVFAFVEDDAATGAIISGLTDGSNPPTTVRQKSTAGESRWNSIAFKVLKGDYWKVAVIETVNAATVFWLQDLP